MNRLTQLFNIQYPIVQAGMIWNSGWRLASAASNSGILGLIGAGSMYPEVLREHIQKSRGHVTGPNLQGDQKITEGTAQTGGKYKKYHDRTMNGH